MIQDFSNTFDGKQAVRIRTVGFTGNRRFIKIVGAILTVAMVTGMMVCVVYSFLIRSGLADLAEKQVSKLELIKIQQGLYEQRNEMLTQENIVASARTFGLYEPGRRQVRHL